MDKVRQWAEAGGGLFAYQKPGDSVVSYRASPLCCSDFWLPPYCPISPSSLSPFPAPQPTEKIPPFAPFFHNLSFTAFVSLSTFSEVSPKYTDSSASPHPFLYTSDFYQSVHRQPYSESRDPEGWKYKQGGPKSFQRGVEKVRSPSLLKYATLSQHLSF